MLDFVERLNKVKIKMFVGLMWGNGRVFLGAFFFICLGMSKCIFIWVFIEVCLFLL